MTTTAAQILTRVRNTVIDVSTELEDRLEDMLQKAQEDAEDYYHFRAIEKTFTATTTDSTAKLDDYPSDWKEHLSNPFIWDGLGWKEIAWLSSIEELKRIDDGALTETDKPDFVYLNDEDEQFECYPLPDTPDDAAAYTVAFLYWGRADTLTDAAVSNWFSNNMAKYLEWETAAEAFHYNRDQEWLSYKAKAKSELQKKKRRDKRSRIPSRFNLPPIRDVNASSALGRM